MTSAGRGGEPAIVRIGCAAAIDRTSPAGTASIRVGRSGTPTAAAVSSSSRSVPGPYRECQGVPACAHRRRVATRPRAPVRLPPHSTDSSALDGPSCGGVMPRIRPSGPMPSRALSTEVTRVAIGIAAPEDGTSSWKSSVRTACDVDQLKGMTSRMVPRITAPAATAPPGAGASTVRRAAIGSPTCADAVETPVVSLISSRVPSGTVPSGAGKTRTPRMANRTTDHANSLRRATTFLLAPRS